MIRALDLVSKVTMKIDIDRLTESELIDLNHRIVARLRMFAQLRAHTSMLELKVGERVSFDTEDGRRIVDALACIVDAVNHGGGVAVMSGDGSYGETALIKNELRYPV